MDFDNEVAEGITHLDVSPNLFHKVDFSSLARCSRNWLPVLVTITSESADNGGDKDFGISDDWIADNVAIQTRSSHGVWQPSFPNYSENSASLSKPKTWSAPINTSIKFWLTKYCELTGLCSLANVSRFAPRFWWQLVGGRVLRLRSISYVIWLQMPFIVLEFFTLLLVLHIQHVFLVSGLCRFKRSLLFFSRNCLTITHVVRRLITSTGCRPWSRKLLYFRKWTDCHSIFCHWLSFITVFVVPSCSPCWIQQSTGPKPWCDFFEHFVHTCFWTTICRGSALTAISSWHSLHYNTVSAFISSTLAYSDHLYIKVPAGYDNEWGTASLCKSSHHMCKFPVNVSFFVVKSSALLLCSD